MNIQDTRNIIPSMEANTNFYIEKTYSEPWQYQRWRFLGKALHMYVC